MSPRKLQEDVKRLRSIRDEKEEVNQISEMAKAGRLLLHLKICSHRTESVPS